MRAQLSRPECLTQADDVLRNDADIESLQTHVAALHAQYLEAAMDGG